MKAVVLRDTSFGIEDWPEPICEGGFERIKVLCTALNHRDQYIREGLYSKIKLPAILGSDICGESSSRVVVDPSMNWGDNPLAQGPDYNPIGMPSQGGLAEYVCVPKENIYPAPSHLTDEQAAALPLAGVTAWRALMTRGAVQPGETILVTGIGGGVALMTMQFALAMGAKVVVTSRSEGKIQKALSMGATHAFLVATSSHSSLPVASSDASLIPRDDSNPVFSDSLKKVLKGLGITLIVDSVAGDTFNDMTDILQPGGRLVVYGSSRGKAPEVNLHRVFWKQLSVLGSTMGTPHDFAQMIAFVNAHEIVPVVDKVYELNETPSAFDRLKESGQFGKIIIRMPNED